MAPLHRFLHHTTRGHVYLRKGNVCQCGHQKPENTAVQLRFVRVCSLYHNLRVVFWVVGRIQSQHNSHPLSARIELRSGVMAMLRAPVRVQTLGLCEPHNLAWARLDEIIC